MNRRLWQTAAAAAVLGIGLLVLARAPRSPDAGGAPSFTRVGRSGPVFTVSVPRARSGNEEYLMRVAEQLSREDRQSGGSGQISVMVWPDDVPVPREPPSTEFDASMRTQIAGIFINPTRNIKHMIRFRDGATVAERDFGTSTR